MGAYVFDQVTICLDYRQNGVISKYYIIAEKQTSEIYEYEPMLNYITFFSFLKSRYNFLAKRSIHKVSIFFQAEAHSKSCQNLQRVSFILRMGGIRQGRPITALLYILLNEEITKTTEPCAF